MSEKKIENAEFAELEQRIGNSVISRINESGKGDLVTNATTKIYGRIVAGGNSLLILDDHATTYDWMIDGATILRAIYDAMFQSLFILNDRNESISLAQKFFDYRIIERKKLIKVFDKGNSALARCLAASERRAQVEPQIEAEYKRVCKLYGYTEGKFPPNWYSPLQLKDIALTTAYSGEFEVFHTQLNMAVHCSPEALEGYFPIARKQLIPLYWKFAFRVLDKLVEYYDITLTAVERALLDTSRSSVLD
jgi:hypothetical protein